MKARAISMASAVLFGGVMLLVGLANMIDPHFGVDFLRAMGSLDPGFHVANGIGSVMLGVAYGVVEGAIGGYVFGAVYDCALRSKRAPTHPFSKVA